MDECRRRESEAQCRHQGLYPIDKKVMLDKFTATLIHEIRQPLTAILGNAQAVQRFMAQEPPDLAEVSALLQDLMQDVQWLDRMIHRLWVLFTHGDSLRETLDINAVLRDIGSALLREQSAGDVTLILDLAADLPQVIGDPVQLQQMILNLLRNAIEAMSSPTVTLRRLRLRTLQFDAATIEITVSDTGIGISAGQVERLFEPFTSTKPAGMGMGLAISRRIVSAHGGRLWATCNPKGGMTFHCTLPAGREVNP
ncbi:MAG: HAMP domain-containing sensor histidine kinase [Candidatus Competibacteraceae bacterium]